MTLISTGLPSVDALLGGGLQPGRLTLICGRSQSGLTTMLDSVAVAAAFRQAAPTVLLDMEAPDYRRRLLRLSSALSGVLLRDFQQGTLTDEQRATVRAADQAGAPFWVANDVTTVHGLAGQLTCDGHHAKAVLVDGTRFLDGPLPTVLRELADLARTTDAAVAATHPAAYDPDLLTAVMPSSALYAADAILWLRRPDLDTGQRDDGPITVVGAGRHAAGSATITADFERARFRDETPAVAR